MSLLSKAADAARPGARDILPVASLVLLLFGLVAGGAPGRTPTFAGALRSADKIGVVGFGLVVLAVVGASILLQPVIIAIGAVLQGRMSAPLLRRLGQQLAWRKRYRQRHLMARLQELEIQLAQGTHLTYADEAELERLGEQIRLYPATASVRPTTLGNVVAAGEQDAGRPYGLDARLALPRLELLLPDSTAKLLASRRDDLGFSLRFCSTLLMAAVASVALLAAQLNSLAILIPILTTVFAWLSYRNAIAAAVTYAETLRVVFDLHRFLLYEALRYPLPTDLDDEHKAANQINGFLASGVINPWPYLHPVKDAGSESKILPKG